MSNRKSPQTCPVLLQDLRASARFYLTIAAVLCAAALWAPAAFAGQIVTWEFSTGNIFVNNLFDPADQPVVFSAQDSQLQNHDIAVSAGRGAPSNMNDLPLTQTIAGLGVCGNNDSLLIECPQVDRIGNNEFVRMELAGSIEQILSVRLGFVTDVLGADTFRIRGANIEDPTNGQLTTLISGAITDIGTLVVPTVYDIALNISGYKYLFFGPSTNDNDGFSILSVTAQVPEPGTLAIFGLGLAGLHLVRRKRAVRG